MTDNPEYAAIYVKNGGTVQEITISRSTLNQMRWDGVLNISPNPQHHISGASGIEYTFSPSVKSQVISRLK